MNVSLFFWPRGGLLVLWCFRLFWLIDYQGRLKVFEDPVQNIKVAL
jgi:hypothetical protein